MPIYEYQCEEGHILEVEQSIHDAPIETCNKAVERYGDTEHMYRCSAPCKRLIGATSFILKGSGWAKDGYGLGGKRKDKRAPKRPKGSGGL